MAQSLNDKKEFISRVIELLAADTVLNAAEHQSIFEQLQATLGSDTKLKAEEFNSPQKRQDLQLTLRAMLEATNYPLNLRQITHTRPDGTKTTFKINNNLIFKNLSSQLTFAEFKKLFKLCRNRGVFDLSFEHHIPSVTLSAGSRHMTRKWPRDHAGMLPLINALYPHELVPGLQAWAQAYTSSREIAAFEEVITNPQSYQQNKGVSHIFRLQENGSLQRDDKWQMNQRLESHGELLNAFASLLTRSLALEKPDERLFTPEIIKAIVYFTHYFYALGISPASCGPWEEIPFPDGINWDCASMILALKKVIELMTQLQFHPKLNNKFQSCEKKLCTKLKTPSLFETLLPLSDFCQKSLEIVRRNYLKEFRDACNRVDASSAMLAASDIELSPNKDLATEIKLRLEILARFSQHLVDKYGARRYSRFAINLDGQTIKSCDSYLNLNSDIMFDNLSQKLSLDKRRKIDETEDNSGDTSEAAHFIERSKGCSEDASAQWSLPLSYAALAYGKMLWRLLEQHRLKGNLSAEEKDLYEQCRNGAEEFIKRSYGNITGIKLDGSLPCKANGQTAEIWKKPEAYQAVSTLRGSGDYAFLPGVNSHLGWDAAVCYTASEIFLSCLEYMETNNMVKNCSTGGCRYNPAQF